MPEIGETLREARMRAKIDVSDVEASTKIRAKYLRALENEEWRLLPGPTFVRTFLRTYADYLGLDSKLLVEEYQVRHEGPSDLDLAPIAPNTMGSERMRLPGPPQLSRGWIIGLALVGLLALLIVLGSLGGGKSNDNATVQTRSTTQPGKAPTGTTPRAAVAPTPPRPTTARLSLVPTDAVYVCLVDGNGKVLIDGRVLQPGDPPTTYRAKRLRVLFGHGPQTMKVNGRTVAVPASSAPIGYEITARSRRELPQSKLPTCTQ